MQASGFYRKHSYFIQQIMIGVKIFKYPVYPYASKAVSVPKTIIK